MELEVTDFHLPQAIDNSITLIRERAARRAITLAVDVDPRLGEIKGDERKVKQVLLNSCPTRSSSRPRRPRRRPGRARGWLRRDLRDGHRRRDRARGPRGVFEEFRQVGSDYARSTRHRARPDPLAAVRRAARR